MPELVVDQVSKSFGRGEAAVHALTDVSVHISGPVFVSVIGPSGCGKSTLLNILSGIERATTGSVSVSSDGGRARIGYVFQSPRLLPWRSVIDNLLFVQRERSVASRRRCIEILEMVGLGDKIDKYPGELSGGMQQRVGIARAFSIEPSVLFMDEPFSHLDAITARVLRSDLHELWKSTQAMVLFVTHDIEEAIELSNRIVVFRKGGRIAEEVEVDIPFPRSVSDEAVAVTKARLFRRIEELGLGEIASA